MNHESPHSLNPDSTEALSLHEIAFVWNEEIRRQRYKELVGQEPKSSLSEEQVAQGILHPEAERERVLQENRAEDQQEAIQTYRR